MRGIFLLSCMFFFTGVKAGGPVLPARIQKLPDSSIRHLQDSAVQNLYFVKKGRPPVFGKNDHQPGRQAFYIYRNCVYDFVLQGGKWIHARIIDIRKDSIYYTLYNDASDTDTLSLHPTSLKKIRLIGDRMMGLYSGYSLRRCRYVLETSTTPKAFAVRMDTVYARDSSHYNVYEVMASLAAWGITEVYRQCGKTYYYEGIGQPVCEDSSQKKPFIIKKGVWFTPSNANKIKGVNVGLLTTSFGGPETLSVYGVNLNADLLSALMTFVSALYLPAGNSLVNMDDTVRLPDTGDTVSGVSISAGGLMSATVLKGVSINGGICTATRSRGLVVTGTQNLTDEFGGVVISGIRNRSIRGKGVQVGLLNICKHLKGVQIGLWNVNSRRKLPLVNWCF